MNNYISSFNGGGNSDYNIIRTPSKAEFDNLVINSDLNGTLNSDFDVRKINVWNYINYIHDDVIMDNTTFQDNTNNTSTRLHWNWPGGPFYTNRDKDFYATINNAYDIESANFRPIIEYRE